MTLSQSDLYSLAIHEGLSDGQAKIAAAIAMAESGGDPNAHNTNSSTGDNSYGLWQINMIEGRDIDPAARRRSYGITSNDQLLDPAVNAKAMRIESQDGRSFAPWSTYKHDTYKKFINNPVTDNSKKAGWLSTIANGAASGLIPGYGAISGIAGAIGNGISNPLDSLNLFADAVTKTAHWVSDSKNWIRVAYVGGGAVLAIGAIVALVGSTKAGKVATKVATKGMV
jgi:hypothetical protein